MDRDTLFEEIRTKLREAQEDTVSDPWLYTDEELIVAVRSAIRNLRAKKVTLSLDLGLDGTFDTDPTETQGVLLALKVVTDLLKGDLANKLARGELGVSVKSVLDTYSTTEAARGFKNIAAEFETEFRTLLSIVLTDATDSASGVFGQQGTSIASS